MRRRKDRFLLILLGVGIVWSIFSGSAMAKREEAEKPIHSYKKVHQIGQADKRTFQVEITVKNQPGQKSREEVCWGTDVVPKQFYIMKAGKYKPIARRQREGEKREEIKAVWETWGENWKEKTMQYQVPPATDGYEEYIFTYYIRANEDYIGGEWFLFPEDAGGEALYIPWRFDTQNGNAEVFYGDKVTLVNEEVYAKEPYEVSGSNTTENPDAFYYVGTDYKDREGNGIVMDFLLESRALDGITEEIQREEDLQLKNWKENVQVVPKTDTEYVMKFRKKPGVCYGKGGQWKPIDPKGGGEDKKQEEMFLTFTEAQIFVDVQVEKGEISIEKVWKDDLLGTGGNCTGFPVALRGEETFLNLIVRPGEKIRVQNLKRGVYHIEENCLETSSFLAYENGKTGRENKEEGVLVFVGFDDRERRIWKEQKVQVYGGNMKRSGE